MGVRRVVMVVAMRMAMVMRVIMSVIVPMMMAVIIMVVMVTMVVRMSMVVIVSMIMVVVAAATIGSMLVMRRLARGRGVHHGLQIGIRRLVLEAGIFAAEREGRRIVEGWLDRYGLQRRRFRMAVHGCPGKAVLATEIGISARGVAIALARTVFQAAADTLDMVVVALLALADVGFKAKHLFAILAHLAVHHSRTLEDLLDAILEGIEHQRVVIQIARLDELDLRMPRRHLVGITIDALHQDASKQEVGEDNDALVAKLGGMGQARLYQREGHARIAGLAPAEAHAFPEHAHDLGGVGIGVRIGRAATDNHQQRLVFIDEAERFVRLVDSRLDAVAGSADHLQIDAELAAVIDDEILVLRLVGVEHRGNVVLGVAGGKQHARHGKDTRDPLFAQAVEAGRNHRIAEFEIAIFDRHIGIAGAQRFRDHGEFLRCVLIAAAVAADHDSEFFRHAIKASLLRFSFCTKRRTYRTFRHGPWPLGQLRNWPPDWVGRTGLFPACRTGAVAHYPELYRRLIERSNRIAALCVTEAPVHRMSRVRPARHAREVAKRRRLVHKVLTFPARVQNLTSSLSVIDLAFQALLLLFIAAFIAGFIDSIAGGGGLITIPAMLIAGIPPLETLGTNKLQSMFGAGSATIAYARKGHVDLKKQLPMAAMAVIGGALGAVVASFVPGDVLRAFMPFLLVAIALYFALKPNLSDIDSHQRLTPFAFGLTFVPMIGFYDGVFGPGTGSFFMLAFVSLAGFGMLKATAHTKLLNFGSNVGAFLVFVAGGVVLWKIGFLMGIGQFLGAQTGSKLAMKNGARLIKPLLVITCVALAIRLLADPTNPVRVWIGI